MTREDIIQMARDAGLVSTYRKYDDWIDAGPSGEELVAFAQLVMAEERKSCELVAWIALLGADIDLAKRVVRAIRAKD